jgi:colanic acid/amylovoran biosynthesis glycosyltransferase
VRNTQGDSGLFCRLVRALGGLAWTLKTNRPMPSASAVAPRLNSKVSPADPEAPVALERIDRFVSRTQNWFYDHMRFVPRHRIVVLCGTLEHRDEFPELDAIHLDPRRPGSRIWYRFRRGALYPPDAWRIRALRPVVFHSHLGYVAVADHPFVRTLEVPWVASFYGADVYLLGPRPEWRERYAALFERAARVLSLGPAMSAALVELGCPTSKLVVHPLGVDASGLPHRPRRLERGEPLRILFAGTFREKKGAEYLIEALGLLNKRGVRFRLALVGDAAGRPGDDATKAAIFRLIGQHGLGDRVEHHSWLRFDQLVALGLASHVFVVPSVTASDGDREGTPAVMGQMMATAMPTIATRHSDIPFTFGPYADRLVPERDAAALAEALHRYVDDPDRMTHEGLEYRAQILAHFDARSCAARLSDLYEELAGARHA